jgi:WhiB family redox-sensing transcriptional regulator
MTFPSWMLHGACRDDPDLFYPDRGGDIRKAKRICRGCPVRQPCLDYALERGERFGVWGGLSERERRRLRRRAS